MSQTRNEKSFLLSRNFPQEEIHETEFHLTSFFFVPMKKKNGCQTLPLQNLSEWSRYLQNVQTVMSWKEVNTTHAKESLKHFLSYFVLLNATEESRGLKWCYGFRIQYSLQELGLCLSSINHFMVTGGGPLVSQPTPASWPQGRQLPSSINPNKKGCSMLP